MSYSIFLFYFLKVFLRLSKCGLVSIRLLIALLIHYLDINASSVHFTAHGHCGCFKFTITMNMM